MPELGAYLKKIREGLGLSMHEVSRRSSLTPSYISKIETGTVFKTISAQALVEFSNTYNVPVPIILEKMYLVERDEDELPGLSSYLRLKYDAPPDAVQEMKIVWRIVKEKYMRSQDIKSKD